MQRLRKPLEDWVAGLSAACWPEVGQVSAGDGTGTRCDLCRNRQAVATFAPAKVCLPCAALAFRGRGHPCRRCSRPVPSAGPGPLCDECQAHLRAAGGGRRPGIERVAALGLYEGMVARWIRDLKYGNQPHLAAPLGSLLAWPASSLLGPPAGSRRARWKALIVPVPMHPARLLQRGYNQASLLANALGHALSLPVLSDPLARVDDGPPQAGLDRGERLRLLGSAFTVVRLAGLPVTDVLLVDDVLTTGATLEACAMQLVEAGARRVFGCVIAAGVQRRLWG